MFLTPFMSLLWYVFIVITHQFDRTSCIIGGKILSITVLPKILVMKIYENGLLK